MPQEAVDSANDRWLRPTVSLRMNPTPLQIACACGDQAGTRILLQAGVTPDLASLACAPSHDCNALLKLMLEPGADVNGKIGNGKSFLHLWIRKELEPDHELLQLLDDHGVD